MEPEIITEAQTWLVNNQGLIIEYAVNIAAALAQAGSSVLVIDHGNQLLGIVTERDLMTRVLAKVLAGRNITANAVAPGFIETPMTDKLNDDQKARILQNIPMARMGQGADIAAGVVYLASKEASYVTGHTLHINGGMAMP